MKDILPYSQTAYQSAHTGYCLRENRLQPVSYTHLNTVVHANTNANNFFLNIFYSPLFYYSRKIISTLLKKINIYLDFTIGLHNIQIIICYIIIVKIYSYARISA